MSIQLFRTGKNLLAAWLLHTTLGTAWEIFPIVQPQVEGYQRVYVYDFVAVAAIAALIVLIEGSRLGEKYRDT